VDGDGDAPGQAAALTGRWRIGRMRAVDPFGKVDTDDAAMLEADIKSGRVTLAYTATVIRHERSDDSPATG